jgi:NAD(P)-dependent dehydrogenase (short-subunit alcohol dehydrogenase family)
MPTFVVTGSASGMGKTTFELLSGRGARVIGVDLRDAEVVADLGTPEGRESMVDAVVEASTGAVDGVIACAGVHPAGGADAASVVSVNYFGAQSTLQGLRPLLARGTDPRAVVIASTALLRGGDPTLVQACLDGDEVHAIACAGTDSADPYGSSKLAIARWVRREAPTAEWAGTGILLNAVAPGLIETPMTAYLLDTPSKRREALEHHGRLLGRIGRPSDVASLLVWLTSPENQIVTGQVLFADGGREAHDRGDAAI